MEKKDHFGTFLKHLRERRGLGINQLATLSGVSNAHISRIERGIRPVPSPAVIEKLSTALDIPYENMMRISGYLYTPDEDENLHSFVKESSFGSYVPNEKFVKIPVLGSIRAGQPAERIENILGYENVEASRIDGRDAFILTVKGNSMAGDHIFDGDMVVVIVQPEVTPSEIAVVALNGENATIKRVKQQGETCVLTPSNPEYEPIIVPASDVHIIGKVIEIRRYI